MSVFKRPESVLVVVYALNTQRVLMLQRNDDSAFWQSVSGSLEQDETAYQAAKREIAEELGIDVVAQQLELIDCQQAVEFEIFPQFRYRYAPEVTHCLEHWFLLPLPMEYAIKLTEHSNYRWVSPKCAVGMTKSWNNAAVIQIHVLGEGINA